MKLKVIELEATAEEIKASKGLGDLLLDVLSEACRKATDCSECNDFQEEDEDDGM